MSETFYGPWNITVAECDVVPAFSFVISGSENADGRYLVQPTVPPESGPEVRVRGAEWQISLELSFTFDDNWASSDVVSRQTEFVPMTGLTITLDSHFRPDDGGDPFFPFVGMILSCTSADPATNPIPTPNPYDFTLPEPEPTG